MPTLYNQCMVRDCVVLTSHITGAVGESGRKASVSRVHTMCHACVGTHLCMRVYVCTL